MMLKTTYAYGLRRRETVMLDETDCRRNPRSAQYRRLGAVQVRYGTATRGGPPKRRAVLTVPEMDWIVDVLDDWFEHGRRLLSPGRPAPTWSP